MPAQLITAGVVAVAFIAWTVLLRVITAGDPVDLGNMFSHPGALKWPRGVQEEDPQPWRLRPPRPSPRCPHAAAGWRRPSGLRRNAPPDASPGEPARRA